MSSSSLRADIIRRGSIEPEQSGPGWAGAGERLAALRYGMYFLLFTLGAMFLMLVSAYIIRMQYWDWQSLTLPGQLWLSTGLLAAASLAFERVRRSASRGRGEGGLFKLALLAAGLLALLFLGSQIAVWQQLRGEGVYLAANPANSFFYLITGLHGLHMLVGIVGWALISVGLMRKSLLQSRRLSVQMCAIYWHFLLAVWLVIFGVLLFT